MADLKVKITVDGKEEYISVEKLAVAMRNVGKAGGDSAAGVGKGKREVDQYKKALKELQEPMEKVEKTFKMLGKASGIFLAVNAVSQLKNGIDSLVEAQKKYNNAAQSAVVRYDQATSSIAKAIMQSKTWQTIMEAIASAATKVEIALGGASSGAIESVKSDLKSLQREQEDIIKYGRLPDPRRMAEITSLGGGDPLAFLSREIASRQSNIKQMEATVKAQAGSDLEFLKSATKGVSNIAEAEIRLARVLEIKKQANFGTVIAKQAAIAEKALQELIEPSQKVEANFGKRFGADLLEQLKKEYENSKKFREEIAKQRESTLRGRVSNEFDSITSAASSIGYKESIDMILANKNATLEEKSKAIDEINKQWDAYDERQQEAIDKQKEADIERNKVFREFRDRQIEAASPFLQILGDGLVGNTKRFRKRLIEAAQDFGSALFSSMIKSGLSALLGGSGSTGLFGTLFGGFRAGGGDVQAGKSYIVGERGAEMFTPTTNGYIAPNKISTTGFDPIASSVPSRQSQQIEVMNNLQLFIDSQQVDASIKRNGSRLNARRGLTGTTA